MNFVLEEERPCMEHHVWHPGVGRRALTRASYQVAMSPRLPRDSETLCLRTKWQAIVRAGAQQWYLWYLRQPGLQISTELVIKEERAHVDCGVEAITMILLLGGTGCESSKAFKVYCSRPALFARICP